MSGIELTAADVMSLLDRARQIGTEDKWSVVAGQWMNAAESEIGRLRAELTRQNEANDLLAEERDAFWKSQSYWIASQKDERQRAERASADLAAAREKCVILVAQVGQLRQFSLGLTKDLAAARALLKSAQRYVYDKHLYKAIDAALAGECTEAEIEQYDRKVER